jgi:hypothetical protein
MCNSTNNCSIPHVSCLQLTAWPLDAVAEACLFDRSCTAFHILLMVQAISVRLSQMAVLMADSEHWQLPSSAGACNACMRAYPECKQLPACSPCKAGTISLRAAALSVASSVATPLCR